jgi:hypothetical protein
VTRARLRARKIDSKIFVRSIFSLQVCSPPSPGGSLQIKFAARPNLAGRRRFISRVRTNSSTHIIRVRPVKGEPENSDPPNILAEIRGRGRLFASLSTWIRSL